MEVEPSHGSPRRQAVALALIAAAAVALRLLAWQRARMMFNDGVDFLWQAERLLAGDWAAALSHPYHPLYAAVTAALSLPAGALVPAALAASVAGGVLTVLGCWGTTRHVLPARPGAALAAALLAAANARLLPLGSDVLSDGLFLGLLACAAWALAGAAAGRGGAGRMLGAGLLVGLAYLARPEGLLLAVALLPWWKTQRTHPGVRARGAAAFLGGVLLCVLPYVVALHELTGVWGLSLKPSLQLAGLRGSGPLLLHPPDGSPLAWGYVPYSPEWKAGRRAPDDEDGDDLGLPPARGESPMQRGSVLPAPPWEPAPLRSGSPQAAPPQAAPAGPPPASAPRVAAPEGSTGATPADAAPPSPAAPREAERLPSPAEATARTVLQFLRTLRGEVLLLLVPGFVVLARTRRAALLALLAVLLPWLAAMAVQVHVNGYVANRHLATGVVLLLPVAGVGLAALWDGRWWWRTLAVLALLAGLDAGLRPRRPDNGPRLAALAWVAEHSRPGQPFLTQRRRDGFYAGRPAIATRFPCDEGALRARLAEDGPSFLVYDLQRVERHHPHWLQENRDVVEVQRFEGEGDTVVVLAPAR